MNASIARAHAVSPDTDADCDLALRDRDRLRLWIKMIRTTRRIEIELRNRLRNEFDETMPRFDVMAALHRQPEGMMMGELSRALMVSNGNVTPIIERLVGTGVVTRSQHQGDRRSLMVSLSASGKRYFERVAESHRSWVNELFAELDDDQVRTLGAGLDNVDRHGLNNHVSPEKNE